MDPSAHQPPDDPSCLAATVELAPTPEVAASVKQDDRRVAVVEGSGPHLTAETRLLLQMRLRAAAVILLTGFVLFLIRNVIGMVLESDTLSEGLPLFLFHLAVTFALAASAFVLSGKRPLPLLWLRALEVAVFGLAVAFLAVLQYRVMLLHARRGDAVLLVAAAKSTLINTLLIIITYAMLIPNTCRRAAAVVLALTAVPLLVQFALLLGHPELVRFVATTSSPALVSENVATMIVGIVLAVYGSSIINALRVEVHEARRLGQYHLHERLGAGGMGEVYLAEHRFLKRPCALKLIRPGSAADPTALARFEREVRTTARLSHPNTIEIYDYGHTEDGTFYYVMEYLRGLSLAELVERHGPLTPGRVIYLLRQACDALAEAHAAGLIHRDIKPPNLFAAQRGGRYDFVKLLDFGLAKPTADPREIGLSREGAITGSPLYMSPEQGTGERPPDARSDLYALGAVAYFLLTGRAPFEGKNAFGVMVAHARDPVVPPSRHRPDLPEDLERVVLRCLAKDPAERFPDAAGLERALASCAASDEWDARSALVWWREVETMEAGRASEGGPSEPTIAYPS